jgi:hypothetical protein
LTARGKHVNQVVVAIAREMAAFAWAIEAGAATDTCTVVTNPRISA